MTRAARPRWSSLRKQLPRQQSATTTSTQEMLENATLVALFGKEDTAAESQSHAARTQDTLVNAVENAEVTEIIRAVFRALTRLRAAETKEFDTIARLETQITNENNETFRHETVSHEFRHSRMTKKKGNARSAGAVNAARRAGETVDDETSSVTPCLLPRKRTSRSTPFSTALIPLSLVVESTVRGVEGVGRANTGAPVRDGWKPTDKRTHCSVKVQVLLSRHRQISKGSKW